MLRAGPEATLQPGARVGVENHFYCGDCYTCAEDRGDICSRLDQYGHGKGTEHGGFSEYSIVSSKYRHHYRVLVLPQHPAGTATPSRRTSPSSRGCCWSHWGWRTTAWRPSR